MKSIVSDRITGPRTFQAAAYARLAGMIRELELPPGARLIESDLALKLSVSKTPIREAILLLERDGLVDIVPHTGATVSWASIAEFEDVQFVLDSIEQPSLPTLVDRLGARDVRALGRLHERCERARADRDSKLYFDTVLDIHRRMFGARRSRWLAHIVEVTLLHARRYQRIFIHQFDDAWDLELEAMVRRFQFVRIGDCSAAAQAVSDGHAALQQLFIERAGNPIVARYLQPQPESGPGADASRSGPIADPRVVRQRAPLEDPHGRSQTTDLLRR